MADKFQTLANSDQIEETGDRSIDVIGTGQDREDQLFEALAGETAREIYKLIQEEARTPRDLADEIDTSIQNIHYHVDNLNDSGLIEPVDTWYSEKGVEMTVYGPTSAPLVISFGSEQEQQEIKDVLKRTFGGIAVLAVVSLGVDLITRELLHPDPLGEIEFVETGVQEGTRFAFDTIATSPGAFFFYGSLTVLAFFLLRQSIAN